MASDGTQYSSQATNVMKTNTVLKVTHNNRCEHCRVKLDSKKFPYIVINNEKIIINNAKFTRTISVLYGLLELHLEMVSGQKELESILDNPELTVDKISFKQQMRVG